MLSATSVRVVAAGVDSIVWLRLSFEGGDAGVAGTTLLCDWGGDPPPEERWVEIMLRRVAGGEPSLGGTSRRGVAGSLFVAALSLLAKRTLDIVRESDALFSGRLDASRRCFCASVGVSSATSNSMPPPAAIAA